MSDAPMSERKVCPHCGALTRPRAECCWLCWATVEPTWAALAPGQVPMGLPESRRPVRRGSAARSARPVAGPAHFQFGLSTLMLIVTLVLIIGGTSMIHPGLGVVAAVVVAAGFLGVITFGAAAPKGVPLTSGQKVAAFCGSGCITFLLLVIIGMVIAVVTVIAFFINCVNSIHS